jgi:hypothetical protein
MPAPRGGGGTSVPVPCGCGAGACRGVFRYVRPTEADGATVSDAGS